MTGMRKLLLSCILGLVVVAVPLSARAADDDGKKRDARLEGYQQVDKEKVDQQPTERRVSLADPGSTTWVWLIMILFILITLGVLLKNAKRTHLD